MTATYSHLKNSKHLRFVELLSVTGSTATVMATSGKMAGMVYEVEVTALVGRNGETVVAEVATEVETETETVESTETATELVASILSAHLVPTKGFVQERRETGQETRAWGGSVHYAGIGRKALPESLRRALSLSPR